MGRSWDKTENDGWLIRNRGLYSPINVGFSQYIRVPFSTDRDDMVFEHCNDCNASSPGPQKMITGLTECPVLQDTVSPKRIEQD